MKKRKKVNGSGRTEANLSYLFSLYNAPFFIYKSLSIGPAGAVPNCLLTPLTASNIIESARSPLMSVFIRYAGCLERTPDSVGL